MRKRIFVVTMVDKRKRERWGEYIETSLTARKRVLEQEPYSEVFTWFDAGNPFEDNKEEYNERLHKLFDSCQIIYFHSTYTASPKSRACYKRAVRQGKVIVLPDNHRNRRRKQRASKNGDDSSRYIITNA